MDTTSVTTNLKSRVLDLCEVFEISWMVVFANNLFDDPCPSFEHGLFSATSNHQMQHARSSQVKHLLQDPHGIFWRLHSMACRSRVCEDLVVVATLGSHVAKEVNRFVVDTG